MTMDLFSQLVPLSFTFVLVLVRVAFFLFFMPLVGTSIVPAPIKAALSLVLSLILVFSVPYAVEPPTEIYQCLLLIIPEALLGFSLALVLRFIFAGIQLGGELVGMQIGFGVAQVIDPVTGVQSPVLAQLTYLTAFLLFLTFNLHHPFILALGEGLRHFPPGSLGLNSKIFLFLVREGVTLFVISLKILAPLLAIMFLVQLALGIVSRFVPQINIMLVSFPLTIGVGLFFFGLTLMLIPKVLSPAFARAVGLFPAILKSFGS
ncbi:flagellar biosynthetic protein FliR [Thermosulfurimonas dismutans]|nr:flagellar biosynthetic protein FliR [Thermosulfurimonas dismutans]